MATTITPATLTVAIAESITLAGTVYDSTTTKTIASVTHIGKRIFEVPSDSSGFTTIATASAAGADTAYDSDNIKYVKITNLDGANAVIVTLSAASNSSAIEVPEGGSICLFSKSVGGSASKAGVSSVAALETIFVRNTSGAAIDLELTVALT